MILLLLLGKVGNPLFYKHKEYRATGTILILRSLFPSKTARSDLCQSTTSYCLSRVLIIATLDTTHNKGFTIELYSSAFLIMIILTRKCKRDKFLTDSLTIVRRRTILCRTLILS